MIGRVVLSALLVTYSAAAFEAVIRLPKMPSFSTSARTALHGNRDQQSRTELLERRRTMVGQCADTYSEAMKAIKPEWTAAALNAYLADPRGGRSRC
jgi:hypothetical protein